ncbi:hypothetical protein K440DRAFT_522554, partial [Wilcoxina mikolae CBS 423.85]
MGWFWNSDGDGDGKDGKPKDTFSHLRPEVREFLEREAPRKPSRNQVPPAGTAPTPQEKAEFDPTSYSKYGKKYADIWAQYRPLSDIEAETRTPAMAVNDVYQSYNDRKSAIGRAAMENCVFEQAAVSECYSSGGLKKFTGCREESRTLNSCFKSQQAFLRTLGYMSDLARDPMVDEKIQMHADRLYREQYQKEKEMEENAKA